MELGCSCTEWQNAPDGKPIFPASVEYPCDTPGRIEWWTLPAFIFQGPVDAILRLLEQEEITRGKARELLAYVFAGCPHRDRSPPPAPWDKLNWSDL
jgi:hypothetical protein